MDALKLLNPENTFRWRFKRNKKSEQEFDNTTGIPKYESNAKICEFENGDKFLVIGDEYFEVNIRDTKEKTRDHLFSEQEENVY